MKVTYPTQSSVDYGVWQIAPEAVAALIGSGAQVVGAGTGVASLVSANKRAKEQLAVQERIGRLQLAQAERSGDRDRVVAARRELLSLQSSPAYQLVAQTQKRNAVLIGLAVVAIMGLTFIATRKK